MIIEIFVKGPLENNNYLLIDEATKDAILIDCTEPSDDIIQKVQDYGAKLKYIILTHAHFDHVLGLNYFKEKYGIKSYVYKDDKFMLEDMNNFMNRLNMPKVEIQNVDGVLSDGEELPFGNYKVKVIHTPGHSKGSCCYLIDDKLFSGDTIFYESLGRTDLIGGSQLEIEKSLNKVIKMLDDSVEIYPGHGWKTTVGHEREYYNIRR